MKRRVAWYLKAISGCFVLLGLVGYWKIAGLKPSVAQTSVAQANISLGEEWQMVAQNPEAEVNPRLIDANTRFGFKLFSQLLQQSQGQTVLISPSSVAIALEMTYNGARGDTQQAMANALELQGLRLEEINQANAALETTLENADPDVKLAIANSLWGATGFPFQPDFLQRNRDFYNAEVTTLDFKNPEAADRINSWVDQNTEGKIPKIIEQIESTEILFLINAVYFKGNWTKPFEVRATSDRPFHRLDGTTKQHPMMSQSGQYAYHETEDFQAISLPYGNERLSMYVFLPKPDSNLTKFYANLTPENWSTWMDQFSRKTGSIQLPRFRFEYSSELKDALAALGMEVAFDRFQADFSGLSSEPTFINRVLHKTFIEVNEEGTEAAAATAVAVATRAMPIRPFEMVVDRPFFCAIRDNQTGTVLFMGSVVEPD